MHIGLIGGIGPAATVAYYTRLVEEFRKAQLRLELTIVHADIAVLGTNARADQRQAQAEVFSSHLHQLKGAGCDVAVITALTGHFCFDEVLNLSPLPLASAVEPIDEFCKLHGIGTVGLLGSPPVLSSHLFGLLKNVQTVTPQNDVETLCNAYVDMVATGKCSESTRKLFVDAGVELVANQGAEAVLLASTDLGLVFNGIEPAYRVIDALDIHVAALIEMASVA